MLLNIMYESLSKLDSTVAVEFTQGTSLAVNIILAMIMFGVALDLRLRQFRDVFKKPQSFITGVFRGTLW